MGVRPKVLAASALALGTVLASGGPVAADTVETRTDTFGPCQVESRLALLDSGTVEASTRVTGTDTSCLEPNVFVRVTYVESDGDAQEVRARGVSSVRYAFAAPAATDVTSFHSAFLEGCAEPADCQSPEYRLGSK